MRETTASGFLGASKNAKDFAVHFGLAILGRRIDKDTSL